MRENKFQSLVILWKHRQNFIISFISPKLLSVSYEVQHLFSKCIKCFPSTSYVGRLTTQQSAVNLHLSQGNHVIFVTLSFSQTSPSTRIKTRSRRFNLSFSGLNSVFKKLPLSWRIIVDGRPNRRDKAAFSNFIVVVWTSSRKPLK